MNRKMQNIPALLLEDFVCFRWDESSACGPTVEGEISAVKKWAA